MRSARKHLTRVALVELTRGGHCNRQQLQVHGTWYMGRTARLVLQGLSFEMFSCTMHDPRSTILESFWTASDFRYIKYHTKKIHAIAGPRTLS
jgi:hypothetical protein